VGGVAAQTGTFARNGEYWTLGYGGRTFSIKDVKGLSYIQRLLEHPGEEFNAIELEAGPELPESGGGDLASILSDANLSVSRPRDLGEMLDEKAKHDFKRRLHELGGELEELKERGDYRRAAEVEAEIDAIADEIRRAQGKGGRDRRMGSVAERARLNVTRAIRAAVQKISEFNGPLGELLNKSVRTGLYCSYAPNPRVPVTWQFASENSGSAVVTEAALPLLNRSEAGFPRALAHRSTFVGREAERGLLRGFLDQALQGEGRVVMISGAPGVGKTSLADEVGAEAAQRGFLALAGSCYDRDDSAPFIPFVEILEAALAQARSPQAFRQALGNDAPEIARLMPQLRRLFPDLPPPLETPPEQSRRLLFDAIVQVLTRTAGDRPVLLVLEDLHWADEGTLSLLGHLARLVAKIRVIIVGTYRDLELDAGGPLAATLDDLMRLHLLRRITLGGLSQPAVAEMIAALCDRDPPSAVVDFIYLGTEGNPFFVEELFQHLVERGRLMDSKGEFRRDLSLAEADVPQSLRLVIGRRLARLGEETRKVLATAAVLGRSFPLELLEAATRVDTDLLLDRIEEAEKAGLLSSTLQGREARFQFSHELIRQAVVGEISAARRQRLHLQVADAIERVYANALEDQANELAHHLWQAGKAADLAKTVRYLELAARRALAQSAYEAALRDVANALELIQAAPDSHECKQRELDLQIACGVGLLATRGWYVPEMAIAYRRAHQLCQNLGDDPRRFHVAFGLWSFHLVCGEHPMARQYAEEMVRLALGMHDDGMMVQASWGIGCTQFFMGELDGARAYLEQAVHLYDRQRHSGLAFQFGQDPCVSSLCFQAMTLLMLGYPDQAEKSAKEGLALARDLHYPFTLAWCLTMLAKYYTIRREYEGAEKLIDEGFPLTKEHGFAFFESGIAAYRIIGLAARGRMAELSAAGGVGLGAIASPDFALAHSWARPAIAEALGSAGQIDMAQTLLEQAVELVERNQERYAESEIYRIRAVLALRRIEASNNATAVDDARAAAEQNFLRAIEIAGRHNARLLRLRAATGLCRLLMQSGRGAEAKLLLARNYELFTEGFDAPDLRAAAALIEELGPDPKAA